jgi:hypothetical protein
MTVHIVALAAGCPIFKGIHMLTYDELRCTVYNAALDIQYAANRYDFYEEEKNDIKREEKNKALKTLVNTCVDTALVSDRSTLNDYIMQLGALALEIGITPDDREDWYHVCELLDIYLPRKEQLDNEEKLIEMGLIQQRFA